MFPLAAAPRFANDSPGVTVNVASSHLVHRAPVSYPAEARANGIEGTVVAQLRLDSNGEVADAAILSGPQELRKTVLESVLAWHFEKSDAATPQTISVRFVKPAALPPPAPNASPLPAAPRPQPAAARKIRQIIINDLPDDMRNSLRSTLPVHEGEDLTPAGYAAAAQTARSFDSHLQLSVRRNADDTFTMFIDLPVTTVAANPAAPQEADESDVMHVGKDVTAPQLISKVEPEYTEEARAAKYQGTVLLSTVIGADGRATNFKVIRSLGMGLDEKAIEAVEKWQFRPGMKAGAPVKVQAQIEVNFRTL